MSNDNNIKQEFISGIIWGIIEKFSSIFVGFFITIMLARKLMPEDYGLINMLAIFNVLALVLIDGGFGQALIQKQNVSQKDYSTVFYFNLLLSLVLYALLFVVSPNIATFYNQPSLTKIARFAFLMLPINSLSIIQHTILTKYMKVKKLTIVSVVSSLFGGIIGVICAFKNMGVWSLVIQTIVSSTTRCIVLWIVNSWKPTWEFSFKTLKSIWSFSISLLGVHTLAAIFQNIYTVIIGRFFNVNDVGYYNQAQRMESTASGVVNNAVQRITFPTFSKIQDDESQLKSAYRRIINVTMFINLPIMLGLLVLANSVFSLLLTEKWLPSVPLFRLLCLTSALYPLHMINAGILKAKAKGKAYFYITLFKYVLMVIFIIFTINKSIWWLLFGLLISTFISAIATMYLCGKYLKFNLIDQFLDLLPIILISIAMVGGMILVSLLNLSDIQDILFQIIVAISIYIGLSYFFKISTFDELKNIVYNLIRK